MIPRQHYQHICDIIYERFRIITFLDFRLSDLRQIVGGTRRGRLLPPRHQRAQDETESRVSGAVFSFAVLTDDCSGIVGSGNQTWNIAFCYPDKSYPESRGFHYLENQAQS